MTPVRVCRVARDDHFQQRVDRNSFRSPRGARGSGNVQPRPIGFKLCEKCYISVIAWDARLQECSTPSIGFNLCEKCCKLVFVLVVGFKPSAIQGEAYLRGLYRIIYSKTISPWLDGAKPACARWIDRLRQRPSSWQPGPSGRRRAVGLKSSARRSKARPRGRERRNCSTTNYSSPQIH